MKVLLSFLANCKEIEKLNRRRVNHEQINQKATITYSNSSSFLTSHQVLNLEVESQKLCRMIPSIVAKIVIRHGDIERVMLWNCELFCACWCILALYYTPHIYIERRINLLRRFVTKIYSIFCQKMAGVFLQTIKFCSCVIHLRKMLVHLRCF